MRTYVHTSLQRHYIGTARALRDDGDDDSDDVQQKDAMTAASVILLPLNGDHVFHSPQKIRKCVTEQSSD